MSETAWGPMSPVKGTMSELWRIGRHDAIVYSTGHSVIPCRTLIGDRCVGELLVTFGGFGGCLVLELSGLFHLE